jgi:hypothetical protein
MLHTKTRDPAELTVAPLSARVPESPATVEVPYAAPGSTVTELTDTFAEDDAYVTLHAVVVARKIGDALEATLNVRRPGSLFRRELVVRTTDIEDGLGQLLQKARRRLREIVADSPLVKGALLAVEPLDAR